MNQSGSTAVDPGLTPPTVTRGDRPEDTLYALWKVAEPWQRPQIEQRLLQQFRRHASKVCWMVLRSHQPDLIDEISVDAVMDLQSFEERSALSTWFHARARFRCTHELRKKITRNEVQLESVVGGVSRHGHLESDYAVREVLALLSDEERELADLKVNAGYSDSEIAEELDVSRQTIQRRWERLKKRLRDLYGGKTAE